MAEVTRISPREAEGRVRSGESLLVCAYGSDEKFGLNHLEGAISLADFQASVDSLPKEKEIIFYCA
jgi:hypothetical protein